jgi:hypothetical protein
VEYLSDTTITGFMGASGRQTLARRKRGTSGERLDNTASVVRKGHGLRDRRDGVGILMILRVAAGVVRFITDSFPFIDWADGTTANAGPFWSSSSGQNAEFTLIVVECRGDGNRVPPDGG